MSPIWVIPAVVALVGATAVTSLVRGTAASARELAAEVARFGELHVALARVRGEVHRAGATVRDLRDR